MSNKSVYNLHTKVKQEQNLQTLHEFGIEQEQLIKPLLEKFFDRKLFQFFDRYSTFDLHDSKGRLLIEVKSVLHTKRKYPNTMIGMNKIKASQPLIKRGINIFLIFNFADKICYYHLNKKGINLSWIKKFKEKDYLYIPIEYLDDIENSSTIFLGNENIKD